MAIPDPWQQPEEPAQDAHTGEEAEVSDSNWARERERAREHAVTRARNYQDESDVSSGGEVVAFPGTTTEIAERDQPGVVEKFSDASKVWYSEAKDTALAAWDGGAWRTRPPALRDMHRRAQRAEWAGDIELLRQVGVAFGWVSLVLTAVGYGFLWVVCRPSRLMVALAVATVIGVFVL